VGCVAERETVDVMAATDTSKADTKHANGTAPKVRRPRKPLDAKAAGIKISAILDALGDGEARAKALHIAKTLSEGGQ